MQGAALAQVELAPPAPGEPITISAARGNCWTEGAYEVWLLDGDCRFVQGTTRAASGQAVVWIDRQSPIGTHRGRVIAYLENEVSIEQAASPASARLTDRSWFGRFETDAAIEVRVPLVAAKPEQSPAILTRGEARHRQLATGVELAQYAAPADGSGAAGPWAPPAQPFAPPPLAPPPAASPLAAPAADLPAAGALGGVRRIRMFSRGDVPVQVEWTSDPGTNRGTATVTAGVNLIVEETGEFGTLDIATDRLVLWTANVLEPNENGETVQPENVPLEIYMEGNIVFRQGERVIFADRMYYDVNNRRGVVLDAELLTPVPNYEGLLRLRAEVLQQTGENEFFAEDMYFTSSRMGEPGYRIQTGQATYQDIQRPAIDPFTGQPLTDPVTGEPVVQHQRRLTSNSNFIYLGNVPVFYWPRLATDLEEPTFYIRRIRFKNDQMFGTQVLTDWNVYQLLGIERPAGTDWDLSIDYLSKRGLGHGTNYIYSRNEFLGFDGPAAGMVDFWGIQDDGRDRLGAGRNDLEPEKHYRHRLFWQHRQMLQSGYQVTAELGYISDRNFLEQYFEREWDEMKDQTTGIELKRLVDNMSYSLSADVRINSFLTQTDWLPRADHFWLGQSIFDTVTWHEHTSVGYGRFNAATTPEDPQDRALFHYLPWEVDPANPAFGASVEGERLVTRHEFDLPFQAGPVKLTPYVLGEAGHWGQDLYGEDYNRLYGQAGLRASIPFWRIDPYVEDDLFNVHGLAHKVVFDAEFLLGRATEDMERLPLYDPLDDDSIEAFRRRAQVTTFGINPFDFGTFVPDRFDERRYALRSGMASWVTSPSMEIADDLTAFRLGMHHRWQTKRGRPENRHIIDWITFDTNAMLYPNADRDNFGESLGLVDYDLRWHVGDRLTLVTNGIFDFFEEGQQIVTVGGFLDRPPRGSLFLGVHLLEGPISSTILTTAYTYRMSPKWVSTFAMAIDLAEDGNIGQNLSLTRIGESFLVTAGVNVDASRDNWGFNLALEPRFLPKTRLGQAAGTRVPVAGAFGLE